MNNECCFICLNKELFYLWQESCRFVDQAMRVMQTMGNAIQNFDNREEFMANMKELSSLHCPVRTNTLAVIHNHEVLTCLCAFVRGWHRIFI